MESVELVGLRVRVVAGNTAFAPTFLVILLHGFGAPGDDLVPLANELVAPDGTWFLIPEAPFNLSDSAPQMGEVRAWWPIDLASVQVAMFSRDLEALAEGLRAGSAPAVERVSRLVEEACRHFGVSSKRTVLGGFSQGAIVALEATLDLRWPLAGLLLFSGLSLYGKTLVERAGAAAPMASVVSHGQSDPILPYSLGEQMGSDLARAGWDVDWVPFVGGHGIPPKAIHAAGRLLSTQLV